MEFILIKVVKTESFLLILIAAFLIILVYVTGHITKFGPAEIFANKMTKIIVVGDVMLGRSVMVQSLKVSNPKYPFLKVADKLKSADLVFANLEAPFVENCPQTNSGMIFCVDPSLVAGLSYANIDVVSLANNHIANYGAKGLADTKRILTAAKIDFTGDGNLTVKSVNGTKFGFLGFNFVDSGPSNSDLKTIANSKKLVNVLIIGVHWGKEYQAEANATQRTIAKKLVETGADLIIGHHPHWVQEEEWINGPTSPDLIGIRGASKPVYYSLGNFVFDQMWSEKTKEGMAVELTFDGQKLVREDKLPVKITSIGQPEFVK